MKHFYLVLLLILTGTMSLSGQSRLFGERSVFTQYYLTPFIVHPGATGQNDYGQIVGLYRNTWATFPGSPRSFAFGYDGAIGNRIGLGLIGFSDDFAAFNTTKGTINLSYTIESTNNKIGFGLAGEYIQYGLTSSSLFSDLVDRSDAEIANRLDGYSFLDGSIGIYGIYDNRITYGLTLPSLISTRLAGDGDSGQSNEIGFIASLGYRLDIPEKDITFEPSVYAQKLLFTPFHVDVNLKASFLSEQLTAALTGSIGAENRIGFLVGTQVSNLGIHYAYNASTHQFQQFNNGSHELSVNFRLQPYKKVNQ